jgi:hypothetical protein
MRVEQIKRLGPVEVLDPTVDGLHDVHRIRIRHGGPLSLRRRISCSRSPFLQRSTWFHAGTVSVTTRGAMCVVPAAVASASPSSAVVVAVVVIVATADLGRKSRYDGFRIHNASSCDQRRDWYVCVCVFGKRRGLVCTRAPIKTVELTHVEQQLITHTHTHAYTCIQTNRVQKTPRKQSETSVAKRVGLTISSIPCDEEDPLPPGVRASTHVTKEDGRVSVITMFVQQHRDDVATQATPLHKVGAVAVPEPVFTGLDAVHTRFVRE